MDAEQNVLEVDLSKVREDCIAETTGFDECFNEFFDDFMNSWDGYATGEERNIENTPAKSRDLQNLTNLTQEMKDDFVLEFSEVIWKDSCIKDSDDVKDSTSKSGNL